MKTKNQNLLWSNSNFRKIWLGQVLSQAGSRAYFISLLWWVVSQESSTPGFLGVIWTGALGSGVLLVLTGIPPLLMSGIIGRTLERVPSRTILMTAELFGGLVTLLVFAASCTDQLNMAGVLFGSFAMSICQSFVDPTLTKSISELVDEADIERAVAFEASTQSLAFFAGAALGAVSNGVFGFSITTAMNGLSYIVAAILAWSTRFKVPVNTISYSLTDKPNENAPFKWSFIPPQVRVLLYSFAIANFFMFPLFIILPNLVNQLHNQYLAGASLLGVLEACFWMGLVCGAYLGPKLTGHLNHVRLCSVSFLVFGCLLSFAGLIQSVPVLAAVLFCGGLSAGLVNVKAIDYFQKTLLDQQKPRFFAILQSFVVGTQPLSYLLFTVILMYMSGFLSLVVCGAGLVICGLILSAANRMNRQG